MGTRGRLAPVTILSGFLAIATHCTRGQEVNLDTVLARAGRQVSGLLSQISDVKCTEVVEQQKFGHGSHIYISQSNTYDYLVMLQADDGNFTFNESRIPIKTSKKSAGPAFLITNGFSTLFLIFHPYYQSSFQFESQGMEVLEGRPLLRIHFSQIPGRPGLSALAVRGREYSLQLNGTAWVDPQTGMIARIEATLQTNMEDIGLRSLRAQVDYLPLSTWGGKGTFLVPSVAVIDVQTLRQHWRNIHTFSKYMRFSVDAKQGPTAQVVKQ